MQLNLLVLKTLQLEALKKQYELLGFSFVYHQHGKGPFHYASEQEGFVLELYPLPHEEVTTPTVRLGFAVENLEELLEQLHSSTWKLCIAKKKSLWGNRAVVQDVDGRKVELVEKQ